MGDGQSPPGSGTEDVVAADLVREAAHDLQNPLNTAKQYARLARESNDPQDFDELETALDRIDQIIQARLKTVDVDPDEEAMVWVPVTEYIQQAWRIAVTGDASLVTDFTVDASPEVLVEPSHLQSILENVFRNAAEHGGEDVTVYVGSLPESSGFYIADDGVGIPADVRQHVFDAGFSTEEDGTGIGLQVVGQIAVEYEWQVRVMEGQLGGARFEVEIPRDAWRAGE